MKPPRSIDIVPKSNVVSLPRREDAGLTRDHYFFVEMWSDMPDAGGRRVETVNISPDNLISHAAFQEALRQRPGKVLVHFNGRHEMTAQRAPDKPPPLGNGRRCGESGRHLL